MTFFSSNYIAFAKSRLATQGAEIREWAQSDNPLLAKTCKEILAAAQQGEEK